MKLAVFITLLATASTFTIKADLPKVAAAAAVAFGVATAPSFAVDVVVAGDVDAGEQIFNSVCAACHAGGQNVIIPQKTLEKEALQKYLAGGRNVAAVVAQITNGKNAMPAFGKRLSDNDIADVASYVIASSEAGWVAPAAGAVAFDVPTASASTGVVAGDVAAGKQIFNAMCAACHAGGQNVIMPQKTLEKEALEKYLAGGRNVAAVVAQVTNGKNAMPAFGGRLPDNDIVDVASYVIASSEAGWE